MVLKNGVGHWTAMIREIWMFMIYDLVDMASLTVKKGGNTKESRKHQHWDFITKLHIQTMLSGLAVMSLN